MSDHTSKQPIIVALLTSQFFLGIVLGALSGYGVNVATEMYTYNKNKNRYITMLYAELEENEKIAKRNEKSSLYFTYYIIQVWDNGIASGYILELDKDDVHKITTIYNIMRSINSDIEDLNKYNAVADASFAALDENAKNYSLLKRQRDYYEKRREETINFMSGNVKKYLEEKLNIK